MGLVAVHRNEMSAVLVRAGLRGGLCAAWLFAVGCTRTESVGEAASCAERACERDASDPVELPIGDASFLPRDPQAFEEMARGVAGDWYGVAAGFEMAAPIGLSFWPGTGALGAGTFYLYCPDASVCPQLGTGYVEGESTGLYRLVNVTATREGQGELSWGDGGPLTQSLTFRSLLLQQNASVLSFVIDVAVGGVKVVVRRGRWPDAGVPLDDGAVDPALDASPGDAGTDAGDNEHELDASLSAEDASDLEMREPYGDSR